MKFRLTRNQIILIGLGVLIVVILVGVLFLFRRSTGGGGPVVSGEITVWGVFDNNRTMSALFDAYNGFRPNVKINYVEKNPLTYEQDLVNALATPQTPDVVMFHNTWLPKHIDKIQPLIPSAMDISQYRSLFPAVVSQDFAPDGVIHAFPLYLDTLALYYNKDVFDQQGIPLPPKTWEAFIDLVPELRQIDPLTNRIEEAAVALGGSERSINRASDLLSLIMLQSGAVMVRERVDRPTFASDPQALQALEFYTSFAQPKTENYTWSDAFSYSVDGFVNEDVAVMFNYQYQGDILAQKNPFLNWQVAPMLQPEAATEAVNYANYWGLAVPAKTRNWRVAWDFITQINKNPDMMRAYTEASGRPPALREIISEYINDPELGVFARQALTARSWPQTDNRVVENAFSKMIEDVLTGRPPFDALREAEEQVKQAARGV